MLHKQRDWTSYGLPAALWGCTPLLRTGGTLVAVRACARVGGTGGGFREVPQPPWATVGRALVLCMWSGMERRVCTCTSKWHHGDRPWCCLGTSPLPLLDLHLESMWPLGAQQSASRSQPFGCRCANRAFGMHIKKCLFSSSLFSPWHHRQTKVVPNFLFRKLDLFLLAMGRSRWAFLYLVRCWFWRKWNAP